MAKKKKIKTKKPTWYYDEMIKNNFYFHIGWSEEDFSKYSKEKYLYDNGDISHVGGRCLEIHSPDTEVFGYVIWIKEKTDYSCLAHECIHAAIWALEKIGVNPLNDTGEIMARLVDVMMDKALKLGEPHSLYEIGD